MWDAKLRIKKPEEKRDKMTKYMITNNGKLQELAKAEKGCWISMTAPNISDLHFISELYQIDLDDLKAALDVDERSRIEVEDNYTMVVVNIPTIEMNNHKELFNTIPTSIFITEYAVITICAEDTPVIKSFENGRIKDFHTQMKSRFILQLLYRTATLYLQYLRTIDKKSEEVENELHKSTQNRELFELLKLEKSLVYFSTALRSNEVVLEKLLRNETIKQYPEDSDLLEDVIVENKQAIEMASIYSGILSGTMDAFASVISNNLNIVMKFLAIITIVMSIPTIIFSAYGMNLKGAGMPFAGSQHGFAIVVAISAIISLMVAFLFRKLKLFK